MSPTGQTQVQTKGFAGGECREASRFVEESLGQRVSETLDGGVSPSGNADRATVSDRVMRPSRGLFNWTLRPSSACWERSRCVLGGLSFSSIPLLGSHCMSLSERLSEVVRACFSGIWIESHEHDEVVLVTECVVPIVHRMNDAVTPAKRCGTSLRWLIMAFGIEPFSRFWFSAHPASL